MEKPAFEIKFRDPSREIKIYVDGTVEFFEFGRQVPAPPGPMLVINRIPELMAQAREEGRSQP